MTDLTGYPELTPYKGGWCGNDLFPEALTTTQRAASIEHVQRLGGRLAQEGYKGFFEVDVLIDTDTDEVSIGTMHLAKGLEFRAVAVMALKPESPPEVAVAETVKSPGSM